MQKSIQDAAEWHWKTFTILNERARLNCQANRGFMGKLFLIKGFGDFSSSNQVNFFFQSVITRIKGDMKWV